MKNWLRLLCSLLVLGVSQAAFSLGLGEISAESALNEPLEARIELLNVGSLSEQEIIVQIGSASDYQMAGVTRDYFHTSIEFEPHLAGPGGQSYISLRTAMPVREPYLNLVVQVRWPQGRLLREYTLLLDLPVFTGRTETSQVEQPRVTTSSSSSTSTSVSGDALSVPRQATAVPPQQVFGGSAEAGADYRVATGDTLWSLAGRVASNQQMSRYQAMLAIRDHNPQAFVNGDPDTLQAGRLIRIPTESQANTRTANQAYNEFVIIQQGGSAGGISATPISATATDFRNQSSAQVSNGGRLALSSSSALGSGNGATEGVEATDALVTENETLKEELDRSELENADLRERIALLEEQLSVSEALIEVESNELANVQQGLAQATEAPQPISETQAPAVAPVPVAPVQTEPDLLSKIMSAAPILGALVLVVLLILVFLLKRRKSSSEDVFLHDDLDDVDTQDNELDGTGYADIEDGDQSDDFESMDGLFGRDQDADEFDDEPELDSDDAHKDFRENEASEASGDMDLEATLEDLDDFADLDSFASDDIEDFDLDSDEGFDETVEGESEPEDDDNLNDMDFESVDVPSSEEDEADEDDDPNAMDFDLDDFNPEVADDEDEGPSGNEMEFDSSDIEIPEADDTDDEELDMGNSTEFDVDSLDLPEDEEDETQPEPVGNEMEFDISDFDLPDADESVEEDEESADGNTMEFDTSEIELPDVDEPEEIVDAAEDNEDDNILDLSSDEAELEIPDDEESQEDMDEMLSDLDDEVSGLPDLDEDDTLEAEDDVEVDLDAGLDLEDDLLEGLDDSEDHSDLAEEMATKLELADAYIEMGDVRGARELIDEIMADGNEEQKAEAAKLADRIERT